MQRDCTMHHKYEISHLKKHAIGEWPSRTLKVIHYNCFYKIGCIHTYHLNFAKTFGMRKPECRAIMWRYLRDPTFSHFNTIPACDIHTHPHTLWHIERHRQTDRHVNSIYPAIIVSHSKIVKSLGKHWSHFSNLQSDTSLCCKIMDTDYLSALYACFCLILVIHCLGVNNFRVITQKRHDQESNSQPLSRKSNSLTSSIPSYTRVRTWCGKYLLLWCCLQPLPNQPSDWRQYGCLKAQCTDPDQLSLPAHQHLLTSKAKETSQS